jgi:hypothetical protein
LHWPHHRHSAELTGGGCISASSLLHEAGTHMEDDKPVWNITTLSPSFVHQTTQGVMSKMIFIVYYITPVQKLYLYLACNCIALATASHWQLHGSGIVSATLTLTLTLTLFKCRCRCHRYRSARALAMHRNHHSCSALTLAPGTGTGTGTGTALHWASSCIGTCNGPCV